MSTPKLYEQMELFYGVNGKYAADDGSIGYIEPTCLMEYVSFTTETGEGFTPESAIKYLFEHINRTMECRAEWERICVIGFEPPVLDKSKSYTSYVAKALLLHNYVQEKLR